MASIIYDQRRHSALVRYHQAVRRAGFLNEDEKINWFVLGASLTTPQLEGAEKTIINEDLRRLKFRGQLERLKPLQ